MASKPGYLKDQDLTPIPNGQLANVAAAWWMKARQELIDAFGFAPANRPSGTYRTAAQQKRINPLTPPSLSDHCKGRAIDIRNWATYHAKDRKKFIAILAANGFLNQQVNGAPFPSEPWHYRNTRTTPPAKAPTTDEETLERKKKTWHG